MPSEKDRKEERAGERPVEVTDENRPEGDPGGDVDIQEYVGGQPGRADPGVTGGPSHEAIGAAEDPSREPQPAPEAGDQRRAGVDRERERQRELERKAAREEGEEFERQFREKTEGAWPEREND